MNYDKQIIRFMNRKSVKNILGTDYQLTPNQKARLCKLFDIYKTPKKMENMLSTVANFIYYDLTNYVGRYRRLSGINGTTKYTQMLRYGRYWASVYSLQSRNKTRHFMNTVEYWAEKGYSVKEANEQVQRVQTERGNKAASKLRGTSRYTIRSVEYWINNGYSEQEAKEKVREIQTTNGIEFYKEKYPENYEKEFSERIQKWKESYNKNDLAEINLKKSPTIDGALARGLTYDEAIIVRQNNIDHMRTIRRLPSQISQKFCSMLETKIQGSCYYSSKNYEKLIAGYRVDFYHKESKTVVEFYGDFFHRNPKLFEADHTVFGTTAREKWEYDNHRELAIRKDKKVEKFFVVWESNFRKNPEQIVNNIVEEIL